MVEAPALDADRAFHILTLGCSKNRVDSDGMDHLLRSRGMTASERPEDARVVIVNTCGFLGAARDESVAAISELLDRRRDDQVVIAAGCMPALGNYRNDIPSGVDHVLTTREWHRIGDVVGGLLGEAPQPEVAGCEGMLTTFSRAQAGPSAYVKVADGCDHACAFCTIPSIKGRQVSKRPLHVLQEIVDLVGQGTKEIVLVAQDTIRYGADLGIKHGLPSLLEQIVEGVPDLPWLRLLYIYPSPLTLRMVDVMAEHDALLPYLDMPIQHADPTVLRNMNRPSNIDHDPPPHRPCPHQDAGRRDAHHPHRRLPRRDRRTSSRRCSTSCGSRSSTTSASSPTRPSRARRRSRSICRRCRPTWPKSGATRSWRRSRRSPCARTRRWSGRRCKS